MSKTQDLRLNDDKVKILDEKIYSSLTENRNY